MQLTNPTPFSDLQLISQANINSENANGSMWMQNLIHGIAMAVCEFKEKTLCELVPEELQHDNAKLLKWAQDNKIELKISPPASSSMISSEQLWVNGIHIGTFIANFTMNEESEIEKCHMTFVPVARRD